MSLGDPGELSGCAKSAEKVIALIRLPGGTDVPSFVCAKASREGQLRLPRRHGRLSEILKPTLPSPARDTSSLESDPSGA